MFCSGFLFLFFVFIFIVCFLLVYLLYLLLFWLVRCFSFNFCCTFWCTCICWGQINNNNNNNVIGKTSDNSQTKKTRMTKLISYIIRFALWFYLLRGRLLFALMSLAHKYPMSNLIWIKSIKSTWRIVFNIICPYIYIY